MSRQGSLLIMTLWVLAILSVFAIAIARYLSLETHLTRYRVAREQAKSLARAGVYLAAMQLTKDAQDPGEQYDWVGDDWAATPPDVTLPEGRIHVLSVTDEQRRLDLNSARSDQLELITGSAEIAQAVRDYVDPEDPTEQRQASPPYAPKDAPVVAMEELRDIPVMTPEAFAALQRATTVGAGTTLNINTVTPEALAAIAPILHDQPSEAIIQILAAARQDPATMDSCIVKDLADMADQLAACTMQDPEAFVELRTKANFSVRSSVFRIVSEGLVDSPKVTYRVEAVVQRSQDGTEPPKILSWRES